MYRLGLFLLVLSTGMSISASAVEWNSCPETNSGKNLTAWRKTLIEQVVEGKYKEVQTAVESCYPDSRPACFGDLEYYVDTKISPEAYGDLNLSQSIPEKDLTIKSEKELPLELLAKNSRGRVIPGAIEIPNNILEIAKAKGWDHLLYKTRSSGGFDLSANLFLLSISTEKIDIYLQTSPHRDASAATKNDPTPTPRNGNFTKALQTLTVITVDKTKNPPVGQLRTLSRMSDPETSTVNEEYAPYKWSNETAALDSCTKCHTQPTKPLSPLGFGHLNGSERKMSPQQIAQVEALNTKLSKVTSWGSMKVNGKTIRLGQTIDTHPLGWAPEASRTREAEFLKQCATNKNLSWDTYEGVSGSYLVQQTSSENPVIDYDKIAGAMNCVKCHDGGTRGVLHKSLMMDEIYFKIIVDRSMPLGVDLNTDERFALFRCLSLERETLMDDWRKSGAWMNKASCFGDQFKGNPPKPKSTSSEQKTNSTKAISQ